MDHVSGFLLKTAARLRVRFPGQQLYCSFTQSGRGEKIQKWKASRRAKAAATILKIKNTNVKKSNEPFLSLVHVCNYFTFQNYAYSQLCLLKAAATILKIKIKMLSNIMNPTFH
jgi:hypothetical protein